MYRPPQGTGYRPQPKKKQNNLGLWTMIGGAALILIIILFAMNSGTPKPRPAPPPTGPAVNLPENQKREMYSSLFSLKGMLKSAGGSSGRSYQILADRYSVPIDTVRAVELEGNSKHWPKESN